MELKNSYKQIKGLLQQLPVRELKLLKQEIDQLVDKQEGQKEKRNAGVLDGKVWMSDDFNEPLDDFKQYMDK